MRNHRITVTMDERETAFIREHMNDKNLRPNDRYGWKFVFDNGAVAQLVICGPTEKNAPDFPLVYSFVYGKTENGQNWAADSNGPVGIFFGTYFFRNGNDNYELCVKPCDDSKWEVRSKNGDKPA